MDANAIWVICASIGVIIAGLAIYYFVIRYDLSRAVNEAIDTVEGLNAKGAAKMREAVDILYVIVPPVFRIFITKARIESLVQKAFDKMEAYAKKQLDKKASII